MWNKFFDMFKKHFNEEVGLVPSVYESDDMEIDFIVGENTGALFGVQVLQFVPDGELEEEEEEDDDDDEEDDDEEDDNDEEDDDDEEYDDDEEDESLGYAIEYTFVKNEKKIEDIKEEKLLTLEFEMESEEEDNEQIQLDFYGTEEEFTDIAVHIDKEFIGVYSEHEDFDF